MARGGKQQMNPDGERVYWQMEIGRGSGGNSGSGWEGIDRWRQERAVEDGI